MENVVLSVVSYNNEFGTLVPCLLSLLMLKLPQSSLTCGDIELGHVTELKTINHYSILDGQDFPDSTLTPWSPWTECSKSCDGGLQERTRTCIIPDGASDDGECAGQPFRNVSKCNSDECPSKFFMYTGFTLQCFNCVSFTTALLHRQCPS